MGVNAWDEPKADVADFVRKNELKHRILLQGGEVAKGYGLLGVPTLFWIDRDGVVTDVELGFESPESLDRRTKRLLAFEE